MEHLDFALFVIAAVSLGSNHLWLGITHRWRNYLKCSDGYSFKRCPFYLQYMVFCFLKDDLSHCKRMPLTNFVGSKYKQ